MKAAICIDPWKYAIFKKRLDEAGYNFKVAKSLTMWTLSVTYTELAPLRKLITETNEEAAATRATKH